MILHTKSDQQGFLCPFEVKSGFGAPKPTRKLKGGPVDQMVDQGAGPGA